MLFNFAEIQNIQVEALDHSALFLSYPVFTGPRQRCFKFENAWKFELACRTIIAEKWQRDATMDFRVRSNCCGQALFAWGEEIRTQFQSEINRCRDSIRCWSSQNSEGAQIRVMEEKNRLYKLLRQQTLYWKQRSKIFWLKQGDVNSKVFHSYAYARSKKNDVRFLVDLGGQKRYWDSGLPALIKEYFVDLFEMRGSSGDEILGAVRPRVSDQHNTILCSDFSIAEVLSVVRSMHSDKSPGSDGFNPGFSSPFGMK